MTSVNIQSTSTILQRLVNMVVARTQLNDLNQGSAMLQVLGAVSNEIELCYLELANLLSLFSIDSANGGDLDALSVLYLPEAIRRKGPLASFGRGRFAVVQAQASQLLIPAGAILRNPSTGQEYKTFEDAVIGVGQNQSDLVLIKALNTGIESNSSSNTITQIVSGGRGANSFVSLATTGGRGRETDEELRIRIRRRVASLAFSTNQALEGRVLEAVYDNRRVISSSLFEDTTDRGFCILYIDDGSPILDQLITEAVADEVLDSSTDEGQRVFFTSLFPILRTNDLLSLSVTLRDENNNELGQRVLTENVDFEVVYSQGRIVLSPDLVFGQQARLPENSKVVLNSYIHRAGLIASAQELVEGSRNKDIPMYRASGVVVEVEPAEKRLQSVSASIVVNDGFDRSAVLVEVKTQINNYINTLGIGDDVVVSEIIERAMAVQGMYDVSVASPANNVTIAITEVARIIFDDIEVQ